MDQVLNKAGTYWFSKRANKEMDSVGQELNVKAEECWWRGILICRGSGLMDQVFNKVGSYWFSKRANKEIDSVGDDLNSLSTSIEGGAKWLVNKIKGKMQKPLPDLLREYDIAVGIFPRDATNYEFNEETRKITVYVPSVCEVGYRDSSVLRFTTTVTGYLEKGKLVDIEGMKTKVMMMWVNVTSITTEASKIYFTAGMKKSRSREAYEVLRDGVIVDKF
ncbi:hypothetical protein NE237_003400 [Protea cynaroides]|uniref:Uncharacterized protein n=1 Tax=Protea cynaroides TaxID=273540 RepID=A0A9Q0KH00_9MAGN|nr:hypothetical protein NE237_003400 [Protea cynaroides]